ncbi:MAG: hypothetical protein JXD18_14090 [Anaerolineae bacterium]|nr:hypothetical protein [Anaerolineae bacterium]
MNEKAKHLEMIQEIINRMARNSFSVKEWSVILVSALFALAAGDSNPQFVYLAYFPAAAFWFLDGYYLWQERLYRKLYDEVRKLGESSIDFSMDTSSVTDEKAPWLIATFSITLWLFHGSIIIAIILVCLLFLLTESK